jgi:small subunit ribosomal protein S3
MGQKVNPVGLRIGINKGWQSRWFATRNYAKILKEDIMIRQMIEDQLGNAGISKVEMERTSEEVKVDVYTSKPGMVIGRRGATINDIRQSIEEKTGNIIQLNIIEVKKPELVARLVAESIAGQLLGRVSFRRAMKKAISLSLKAGAKGIKIKCSGRLGGAEMARTEWYREGRVPLHTLRANIDYGFAEANTTFGKIGVKVWIYLGDVILDNTGNEKGSEKSQEKSGKQVKKTGIPFGKGKAKRGKKGRDIKKTVISTVIGSNGTVETAGEEDKKGKEEPAKDKEDAGSVAEAGNVEDTGSVSGEVETEKGEKDKK